MEKDSPQPSRGAAADPHVEEAMIRKLVHGFYDRVRSDELLGPVFSAQISDWAPHLEKMCDFWSSIMLTSGRYSGQPMRMHMPLPISGTHFDRWLTLFRETARELFAADVAELFISRAERIAESLELGIAGGRGQILRKGDRLPPHS